MQQKYSPWAADDLTLNASETVAFSDWGFDNSGAPTLNFGNWSAGGGWQFSTPLSQDDYCGVDIAFEATTETHVTFFIDFEGDAEQSIDVPTGSTRPKDACSRRASRRESISKTARNSW